MNNAKNLHFAALDSAMFWQMGKHCGIKNGLVSYYHAFNQGNDKKSLDAFPFFKCNWIVDSGLFTMMFGAGKNKTYSEKDLWDYTKKYVNIWKNKKDFNGYIVEMDVHKLLGMDKVYEFRRYFEENFPIERTIFVFHAEEKIAGLKRMAKKYPYIALSIPEFRFLAKNVKISVRELINLHLNIIYKENPNCKVHLLGNTQPSLLKGFKFFSCDSSSWLSVCTFNRFGNVQKNGKIKSMQAPEIPITKENSKLKEKYNLKNDKQLQYFLKGCLSIESYKRLQEVIRR